MQIPASPEEITPAYLTSVLRQAGFIDKSSVDSVLVEVVPAGTGFVGQSAHLKITYDVAEPGPPAALFAKLSSANPELLDRLRKLGLYETEAGFYRDLSADCPQRVPRAYASLYEPATGKSLLLLEEIGHLRFGDNLEGSTVEEAQAAIINLARMQAHYWNNQVLARCGWLRSAAHDRNGMPNLVRSLYPVFEERYAGMAPTTVIKAAKLLCDRVEAWIDSHSSGPRTLAHGDYRPDNFAFTQDGEMVVFDWQTARYDQGSLDVAYFLAFALPVNLRRSHEGALLDLYHRALLEHGIRNYGFDEVLANHRRSVGSAVLRLVTAGAMLDLSSERGKRLIGALFERVGAAVEDHDFLSWGDQAAKGGTPHGAT